MVRLTGQGSNQCGAKRQARMSAGASAPPHRSVERSETSVRYKEMVRLIGESSNQIRLKAPSATWRSAASAAPYRSGEGIAGANSDCPEHKREIKEMVRMAGLEPARALQPNGF